MIRVSATTLEAFRRVFQTEYAPEQELIDSILGKPIPHRWQMNAGAAWHQRLWMLGQGWPPDGEPGLHGYSFSADTQKLWGDWLVGEPALWEAKATRDIDCWGVPVRLVAQVDAIRGLIIREFKTRFSSPDPADYHASLQWRAYLLCHEAKKVEYFVSHFDEPDEAGRLRLKETCYFREYPYSNMEQDLNRWCGEFLDWAHRHRLTEYLQRAGSTPGLEEVA